MAGGWLWAVNGCVEFKLQMPRFRKITPAIVAQAEGYTRSCQFRTDDSITHQPAQMMWNMKSFRSQSVFLRPDYIHNTSIYCN